MDIDDILAEAARPTHPEAFDDNEWEDTGTHTSGRHGATKEADIQALVRAWVNEKNAPEVLPWPELLMDRVLHRVRRQIELVELQTGDMDPKINFRLIIVQTELERWKYLIRAYLRTRIAKIDQHAAYYLADPDRTARLSPTEIDYATSHQTLLQGHYRAAFLAQFPTSLQGLEDTSAGLTMVEGPDVDRAVFVRALGDVHQRVAVEGTDIDFDLRPGQMYVVRWSAVKSAVERGEAELM